MNILFATSIPFLDFICAGLDTDNLPLVYCIPQIVVVVTVVENVFEDINLRDWTTPKHFNHISFEQQ